jgi:hypothetical protein
MIAADRGIFTYYCRLFQPNLLDQSVKQKNEQFNTCVGSLIGRIDAKLRVSIASSRFVSAVVISVDLLVNKCSCAGCVCL